MNWVSISFLVLSEAYSSRYKKVIQAHTARARAKAVGSLVHSIHRVNDEKEGHEKRGHEESHLRYGHEHGYGYGHKYGVNRLGRRHASCPAMAHARSRWRDGTLDASGDEDGVLALSPACRCLRIHDGELNSDLQGLRRIMSADGEDEENRVDSVDFATTTRNAPSAS